MKCPVCHSKSIHIATAVAGMKYYQCTDPDCRQKHDKNGVPTYGVAGGQYKVQA